MDCLASKRIQLQELRKGRTDEGASGLTPNGVAEGLGESELGALCSGKAGVAVLDISHAFTEKEDWKIR